MNELVKSSGPHRFEPGNAHGRGRPKGARNKIGADLIDAMERITSNPELAEAHVMRLYNDFPEAFAKLWAMIGIPKESVSKLQIEQAAPGGLAPEEWSQLRELLLVIEQARLGDVEPSQIFDGIATYLRSEFATPIEHSPALPPPPYR